MLITVWSRDQFLAGAQVGQPSLIKHYYYYYFRGKIKWYLPSFEAGKMEKNRNGEAISAVVVKVVTGKVADIIPVTPLRPLQDIGLHF